MNFQLTRQYTENGMQLARSVCQFPFEFNNAQRCIAYRYIYMYHDRQRGITRKYLTEKINELFNETINRPKPDMTCLFELADIMTTYEPKSSEALLNRLRELNAIINNKFEQEEARRNANKPKKVETQVPLILKSKSVYSDSQNVHTTGINNSSLVAIERLYSLTEKDIQRIKTLNAERIRANQFFILELLETSLLQGNEDKRETIQATIKYMKTSVAVFGQNRRSLEDIFIALFIWIHKSKDRKELMKRLFEEMGAMEGYCNSGHMTRLLSVIQGFTDDPLLTIRISVKEQCKAVVENITEKLKSCTNEAILDGIVEKNDEFTAYIKSIIAEQRPKWLTEYGQDFDDCVNKAVQDYVKIEI